MKYSVGLGFRMDLGVGFFGFSTVNWAWRLITFAGYLRKFLGD